MASLNGEDELQGYVLLDQRQNLEIEVKKKLLMVIQILGSTRPNAEF